MAIIAAHRQILRYAAEKHLMDTPRTTLVAAIVQDGAATGCTAVIRVCILCVRASCWRARATTPTWSSTSTSKPAWLFRPISTATCSTPAWAHPPSRCLTSLARFPCSRATASCCAQTACGAIWKTRYRLPLGPKRRGRRRPELVERALVQGGPQSDNVTVIAMEWETPDVFESTRGSHLYRHD